MSGDDKASAPRQDSAAVINDIQLARSLSLALSLSLSNQFIMDTVANNINRVRSSNTTRVELNERASLSLSLSLSLPLPLPLSLSLPLCYD